MVIEIFNWDVIGKYSKCFSIDSSKLSKLFKKILPEQKSSKVNLIFLSQEEIKGLNSEYRHKNSVTDVLSFELNENGVLGEIYICPEYVYTTRGEVGFQEEILRLIVHGLLHLHGYDHEGEFDENNSIQEEMFVKQEEILQNIKRNI